MKGETKLPVTKYATVNGQLVGETGPNGTIYYLDDALGSVRSTIDENNNVLNQYWYNPYGGLIDQSNDSYSPKFLWVGTQGYRKTGRLHSDVYVRARHFGGNEGRWTTVDPLCGHDNFPFAIRGLVPQRVRTELVSPAGHAARQSR